MVAAMAEAMAGNEVDLFGWSCCSSYSNRMLCLRLCHFGTFKCASLSCSDVALVGPLPQACLLLALALGQAPSLRGVANNVLTFLFALTLASHDFLM